MKSDDTSDILFNEAFKFKLKMKSDDTSDILFNEAFKFKLKRRFKEDKTRQYTK